MITCWWSILLIGASQTAVKSRMLKKSVAGGRYLLIWWLGTTAVKYIKPCGQNFTPQYYMVAFDRHCLSWNAWDFLHSTVCPILRRKRGPQLGACLGLSTGRVLSQYSTSQFVSICFTASTFQAFQFLAYKPPAFVDKKKRKIHLWIECSESKFQTLRTELFVNIILNF